MWDVRKKISVLVGGSDPKKRSRLFNRTFFISRSELMIFIYTSHHFKITDYEYA